MSKLDTVVFVVDGEQIVEGPIRSFSGYIDETTTPHGVAPRYHLRDAELWTWGVSGNNPRMVRAFETVEEAAIALDETFVFDFWNCHEINAFSTRAAAEEFLTEQREG